MLDIKELIGKNVKHNVLGMGVIEDVEENIMIVCFGNRRECKFSYPSAFRSFLKLEGEELKEEIAKDLDAWLVESKTLDSEAIARKTQATQAAIQVRETERKRVRIERAKADAQRSRFFAGLDSRSPRNAEAKEA